MLKDNETIKALEICATYGAKCTDCPAFVKVDRSNCKNVLVGALDIINRQKTEIDILIRKKETLRDEISELQRKNSELEIELTAMRGAANSYKRHYNNALREIERIVVMTVETAQKERERE